jgi:protein TonB
MRNDAAAGGNVVGKPGRPEATRWWADRTMLRRGLVASVAVHAAAALGVSLVHPAVPPEVTMASVELIVATAEPAPAASPSPAPPPPPAPPPQAEAPTGPAPPVLPAEAPPRRPSPRPPPRPPGPQPAPPRASASPVETARPVAAPPPVTPAPAVQPAPSSPAWLAGVSAWLAAHRFYPEMARRLGRQGTVVVRFTADRAGHVLDVGLVSGSGMAVLDEAAQTLVRTARLPPFPPDMAQLQQSVTVPVNYRLD